MSSTKTIASVERRQAAPAGARRRPIGPLAFVRLLRDNAVSIYPPEAFEADYSARQLGFQRFVLLNQPDYIKHVLVTNAANYGKGRLNRQILGPILGEGLLTAEGELWRRQRRIAAPAFHRRRLAELAEIMIDCATAHVERWRPIAAEGRERDIGVDMMALTMEIVTKTLFSSDIAPKTDGLGRSIAKILEGYGRPSLLDLLGLPEWLPRRRSAEAVAAKIRVDRLVRDIIRGRRRDGERRGDLLDMLIAARDEETGRGMSDQQLRDEIMTLFAAGHETTATALTWVWYLLSQHPDVEAAFHDELDHELGGRGVRAGDLERLRLTRMIFDEALRLYPPAFSLNRVALADDLIGPVDIRRGDLITISPYVTHRNPKLWPDPERFDPGRFAPDKVAGRHKFAYFPFGGGPRICIGNGFAVMEGCLIMAAIGQNYRLRLKPGHKVEPQGRITLRPRHGMVMTVERRQDNRTT